MMKNGADVKVLVYPETREDIKKIRKDLQSEEVEEMKESSSEI